MTKITAFHTPRHFDGSPRWHDEQTRPADGGRVADIVLRTNPSDGYVPAAMLVSGLAVPHGIGGGDVLTCDETRVFGRDTICDVPVHCWTIAVMGRPRTDPAPANATEADRGARHPDHWSPDVEGPHLAWARKASHGLPAVRAEPPGDMTAQATAVAPRGLTDCRRLRPGVPATVTCLASQITAERARIDSVAGGQP